MTFWQALNSLPSQVLSNDMSQLQISHPSFNSYTNMLNIYEFPYRNFSVYPFNPETYPCGLNFYHQNSSMPCISTIQKSSINSHLQIDNLNQQLDQKTQENKQLSSQKRETTLIKPNKEERGNKKQKRADFSKKRRFSNYYWSSEQHQIYCQFLRSHSKLFDLGIKERKIRRVNVIMSKYLKSRTPVQCHTHHQKMMKKYGSIANIIQMKERKTISEELDKSDEIESHAQSVKLRATSESSSSENNLMNNS